MRRLSVFAFSVVLSLALVAGLNWWVDPLADRYDPSPLAAALRHSTPCLVSESVVGARAWPDLKIDITRRRRARIVVAGASRAGSIGARSPRERFANVALAGMGINALMPLLERLGEVVDEPITLYLNAEPWWFAEGGWGSPLYRESVLHRAKELLSGDTFRATLSLLRRAPGAIRHPRRLRTWSVSQAHAGCVVDDPARATIAGVANAWGADGRFYSHWEINGLSAPRQIRFVDGNRDAFFADGIVEEKRRALEQALEFARERRWQVVGFAPPFSDDSLRALRRDPRTTQLMRAYEREIPAVFRRYGFRYIDLLEVAKVPCRNDQFMYDDGGHPDPACARGIRRRLDQAAGLRG